MEYRRAQGIDFEQIVELQTQNLYTNLRADQLSYGFLSRAYTVQEFQEMDKSIAVLVAVEEKVRGYLAAASVSYNQQFPYPAALFQAARLITYQNKSLMDYRCCLVNPICIAKEYRGSEIFKNLCQVMLPIISQNYEMALAFVATANERSLHACQKMMQIVGQFTVDNHHFWILLRDLGSHQ